MEGTTAGAEEGRERGRAERVGHGIVLIDVSSWLIYSTWGSQNCSAAVYMNLREKNLGSKACWHDNREYSKQSTMKQCVYLEKKTLNY